MTFVWERQLSTGRKITDSIEITDIEIVQDEEGIAKPRNLFLSWFASNISAFGMSYSTWILGFGISFIQAIIISIIGVILSFAICDAIALGGERGSVLTMAMSCAAFGVDGARIPGVVSWLTSIGWETSLAIAAVLVTNTILARLGWTGDDSTVVKAIVAAIITVLIVLGAVAGYRIIMKMQAVLTWATGIATIIYALLVSPHIDFVAIVTYPNGPLASALGAFIMVMTGMGLGWVNIVADWSRYQSHETPGSQIVFWNTFSRLLDPVFLISFGLMLVGSNEKLTNVIGGDPAGALAMLLPTWFLVPFLITAILSLLSGAINRTYSSGLTLLTSGIHIPRPLASLIDGVILTCDIIYATFFSLTSIGPLQSFLVALGVPLTAWTGIMMADITLWKEDYDEEALLTTNGEYGSYNTISLVTPVVCCFTDWGLAINGSADAPFNDWQGYLLPLVDGKDGAQGSDNTGAISSLIIGCATYYGTHVKRTHSQELAQESTMADSRQEALEYCLKRTPQRIAQVKAAVQLTQERAQRENHDVLVVLGSGLHDVVCSLEKNPVELPLKELPGAKIPSAQGHGARTVSVQIETGAKTVNTLACIDRIHLYEGHTPADLCFVPQVTAMTGIQATFLTNASGCLQPWELGDIMAIRDYINFNGASSFTGPAFIDISQVQNSDLTAAIKKHISRSGVYATSRRPEYQTLAESIMIRNNGIDMVGTSTVLKAIALYQLGVRARGTSATSGLTLSSTLTTHSEVLHAVRSTIPCV